MADDSRRTWQDWLGDAQESGTSDRGKVPRNPFPRAHQTHALQGVLCSNNSIDLVAQCPSRRDAVKLWDFFYQRVDPLVRTSFSWTLKPLQLASTHPGSEKQINSAAEYAFIFSLYLLTIVSLSEEECKTEFLQHRSMLLSNFQALCDEALARTNIFCMTDIIVFKALIF